MFGFEAFDKGRAPGENKNILASLHAKKKKGKKNNKMTKQDAFYSRVCKELTDTMTLSPSQTFSQK